MDLAHEEVSIQWRLGLCHPEGNGRQGLVVLLRADASTLTLSPIGRLYYGGFCHEGVWHSEYTCLMVWQFAWKIRLR